MNEKFVKFLVDDSRPEETMNYPMLHGFLFAIACSPELIAPGMWFPYVFNHSDPNYKNDEALEMDAEIKTVLTTIEDQLSMKMATLPPVFKPAEEVMDNFEEDAFHAHWGRGILFGHNILSEVWNTYLPEEMRSPQVASLNTLTFFASKAHAEEICRASGIDDLAVETMAETVLENFQWAMSSYANIGIVLRSAIDEYGAQHPNS